MGDGIERQGVPNQWKRQSKGEVLKNTVAGHLLREEQAIIERAKAWQDRPSLSAPSAWLPNHTNVKPGNAFKVKYFDRVKYTMDSLLPSKGSTACGTVPSNLNHLFLMLTTSYEGAIRMFLAPQALVLPLFIIQTEEDDEGV